MNQIMTIPHQLVTFESGEAGTVRATLAAMPDGSARGNLAIVTRRAGRRYRALSGACDLTRDESGPCARIQLETLLNRAGIEDLVELTIDLISSDAAAGGRVGALLLERLTDGEVIARAQVTLTVD